MHFLDKKLSKACGKLWTIWSCDRYLSWSKSFMWWMARSAIWFPWLNLTITCPFLVHVDSNLPSYLMFRACFDRNWFFDVRCSLMYTFVPFKFWPLRKTSFLFLRFTKRMMISSGLLGISDLSGWMSDTSSGLMLITLLPWILKLGFLGLQLPQLSDFDRV